MTADTLPDIEVGQVWKRKRDGSRLMVIAIDDCWEDVTYRRMYPSGGQSRPQQIFAANLRRHYALAPTA